MNKKVVFIARDAAPSRCFQRLEPVLKERFDVDLIVGDGKPLSVSEEDIVRRASSADLLVLGMSSFLELAKPEIAAGNAARNAGVPYGFYGDIPRCWMRAWFGDLVRNAAFYLSISQEDADAARQVFPQEAELLGTGNPLREDMAFPRFTREEVRAKLNIPESTKLVLAGGVKVGIGNIISWGILVDALAVLARGGQSFQVILTTHPGDLTPTEIYEQLLSQLRYPLGSVPVRIVGRDIFTTSDIVPGADIIIEFGGGSIGIEGAYQNIPVISLGLELWFQILEQAIGTRTLEIVQGGVAESVVADTGKLTEAIRRLLTPEGFAEMKARQQRAYPKPKERGAALRKITDAIAQYLNK